MKKIYLFFTLGALFRYLTIDPSSWFLFSLSLTSWSFPNYELKLLGPLFVLKFFKESQKMAFSPFFSFTTSLQMVISQPFLKNIAWNFFCNFQTCWFSKIEKKIGVPWPFNVVFRSMNSKTQYFGAIFVFLAKFPYEVI